MSVFGRALPRRAATGLDAHVLAPVFMTVFVGLLWVMGIRPFVSQIAGDLNSSVPLVGQVLSTGMMVTAVAGLFAGPLADHYGHRRSILTGLGLMSASALLIGAATNVIALGLAMLVGGLGLAMTYGVAFAVVSTRFSGDERRRALGMTQAAASLAVIAGSPALVAVATILLWRGSFLFLAIAISIAMAVVFKGLPADPPVQGRCASPRRILRAYKPLIAVVNMRVLYTASTLRAITMLGLAVYLGAFYVDELGFSSREVGTAFMIEGVGQLAGNLAGGGRLGSYSPRYTFALGTILMGAGAIAIYTVQPGPLATVALVMAIAFAGGITFTNLTTLLAQETPGGAATTMVLNISIMGLGGAIGSTAGGLLIGIGGYRLIGVAALLFTAIAAGLVLTGRGKGIGSRE